MVATAVLLDVLPALWARLGVCGHPVARLAVTGSLLIPLLPSEYEKNMVRSMYGVRAWIHKRLVTPEMLLITPEGGIPSSYFRMDSHGACARGVRIASTLETKDLPTTALRLNKSISEDLGEGGGVSGAAPADTLDSH